MREEAIRYPDAADGLPYELLRWRNRIRKNWTCWGGIEMGGKGAEEIENFLVQVKKKFNPELILLFGSRAREWTSKDKWLWPFNCKRILPGSPFSRNEYTNF